MSQRRLDGVKQYAPAKPEPPECADCGADEEYAEASCRDTWPDGKHLRYYPSTDEYSCSPCANGEREREAHPIGDFKLPWSDPESSPLDDFRKAVREIKGADKVFPVVKQSAPYHIYDKPCEHVDFIGKVKDMKIDRDLTRISMRFAEEANGGPLPDYEEDYDD